VRRPTVQQSRADISPIHRATDYAQPTTTKHAISSPSLETRNMRRFTIALGLVIASTAASSAQGSLPTPSLWQSERGAILKVLSIDSATGNFSGIFISSPTGPCPAVPYDLAGRVSPRRHVAFTTSRTWTSDCWGTVVWSGRAISPTAAAVRWTARSVGPNGQVVRTRGTEIFKRI
jgi:hypothetical protein